MITKRNIMKFGATESVSLHKFWLIFFVVNSQFMYTKIWLWKLAQINRFYRGNLTSSFLRIHIMKICVNKPVWSWKFWFIFFFENLQFTNIQMQVWKLTQINQIHIGNFVPSFFFWKFVFCVNLKYWERILFMQMNHFRNKPVSITQIR